MRSTSRGRRGVALVLLVCVLLQWTGTAAGAGEPESPCLLLKYAAPRIPEREAKARLDAVAASLAARMDVRWSPVPAGEPPQGDDGALPAPDRETIRQVSSLIGDASLRMEGMEVREAERLLSSAESLLRSRRIDPAVRALFPEILLRQGVIRLWEGDRAGAEALFARARALVPGFSPDPARYSPQVREAWANTESRLPDGAGLDLVSDPPGAVIRIDGVERGVAPLKARVAAGRPVEVRFSMPGRRESVRTGQWLPGETATVAATLAVDPAGRLGMLLDAPGDGRETKALVSDILGKAGAGRIVLLVLDGEEGRRIVRVHVASARDLSPRVLGTADAGDGAVPDGTAEAARTMLVAAGWPGPPQKIREAKRAWYYRWEFWSAVIAVAAGAAFAFGGGGGGGDSSGSGNVNF